MTGDGITFTDITDTLINGGLFRNFSGSGIKLSGTSSNNEFYSIIIENCSGHGIHVAGASHLNLFSLSVSNPAGIANIANNAGDGILIVRECRHPSSDWVEPDPKTSDSETFGTH